MSSKLRRSRRAQARTRLICIVSHACPAPKEAYPQVQRMAVFERCGKSLSTGGDASTYIEREACLSGCMYGWTYVCTSREGKGKDMSVCMHSRSRHPSQQRIASHRRSLARVPPASHISDPSVLHGTHYGLALSHPAADSIEAKRSTTTALLSGASSIHQNPPPSNSLCALLAAAHCFFPASCLAGPPELPSHPRDSFHAIPIC
ncbi:hypothetical protein H112_05072 [Trichophyton rubrum D6]|uniref:Uncharacterized protein n=2 Tax=Trichophyton TaxID=5550 RepID=A0A022VZQ4_TRIRU|nr:hypothetical protein H100_05096 [Trichophyton rubrum MR850]EZF41070.1 hypothetical protein H102_05081 [Trichophyton rubrum CBS 100081]EZF51576.1 hypothetical protein H103_05083 [Trichophyton rubrum CBS 288.86]EZF62322.1 hypothetical protein H104_05077 [Trichophyton rubrum CBS 289.86]EZF72821.1 hypothetical protein H105_05103 [Trichophyton soudanense CBS 452.61]EZF83536.1 hypothetical protein H110_05082 [Trichophyton rubrum MR1448]EZF94185.1 hypothetical protein H113_05123 [Trichophyton rub